MAELEPIGLTPGIRPGKAPYKRIATEAASQLRARRMIHSLLSSYQLHAEHVASAGLVDGDLGA